MHELMTLSEAQFDDAVSAPRLLVLGLDEGKGCAALLSAAAARERGAAIEFARLPLPDLQRLVWQRLPGPAGERILLIRSGVVLVDAALADLSAAALDDQITLAASADPREVARRALGDFAGMGPSDASTFAEGLAGRFRHSLLGSSVLVFRAWGDCRHEVINAGIQGSSSEIRTGRWSRLEDGRVELRWTREDSDLEVGMSRDRASQEIDRVERVRVRWEQSRAIEIRGDGDALPGSTPPAHTYVRED